MGNRNNEKSDFSRWDVMDEKIGFFLKLLSLDSHTFAKIFIQKKLDVDVDVFKVTCTLV